MQLTIITTTFYPEINGVTISLVELIRQLKKKSINVKVLAPDYSEIQHLLNYDKLNNISKNCEIISYPSTKFEGYNFARKPKVFSIKYQPKSNEKVIVIEPDRLQFGNLSFPVKGKSKYYAFMRQDYYKAAELYYSPLKFKLAQPVLKNFISWVYNHFDKTLVLSNFAKSNLEQLGVKKTIEVVKQGLNHEFFHFQEITPIALPLCITYIGRIALEKNLKLLFDALNKDCFNKSNIQVHIIGDGPYKKEIEKQYNLEFVKFHGFLNQLEIVSMIKKSHFIINPCPYETFGNTIIEAMACGRPVIGLNEGAADEHILDSKNGFKISNNADELSNLLMYLTNNNIDINQIGKNAHEYSMIYTWEKACDSFLNAIQ